MQTFTRKQLRALYLAAPGTVAIQDNGSLTIDARMAEDDRVRSGVWRMQVLQDGTVIRYLEGGGIRTVSLEEAEYIEAQAKLEEAAEAEERTLDAIRNGATHASYDWDAGTVVFTEPTFQGVANL